MLDFGDTTRDFCYSIFLSVINAKNIADENGSICHQNLLSIFLVTNIDGVSNETYSGVMNFLFYSCEVF